MFLLDKRLSTEDLLGFAITKYREPGIIFACNLLYVMRQSLVSTKMALTQFRSKFDLPVLGFSVTLKADAGHFVISAGLLMTGQIRDISHGNVHESNT